MAVEAALKIFRIGFDEILQNANHLDRVSEKTRSRSHDFRQFRCALRERYQVVSKQHILKHEVGHTSQSGQTKRRRSTTVLNQQPIEKVLPGGNV
jgi:hypothetical protein